MIMKIVFVSLSAGLLAIAGALAIAHFTRLKKTAIDPTKPVDLFLSFNGLVDEIMDIRVDAERLNRALFYLGCAEKQLRKPFQECKDLHARHPLSLGKLEAAYHTAIQELTKASGEGRAAWRPYDGSNSFEQLDELLARHRLPTTGGANDYQNGFIVQALVRSDHNFNSRIIIHV